MVIVRTSKMFVVDRKVNTMGDNIGLKMSESTPQLKLLSYVLWISCWADC